MFSGTLQPQHFYRDTLGLSESTAWLGVEGPFKPEQLTVHVAAHVSTRWRERERSLAPIADLIARQYAVRPGNYLAFLSSFDYLEGSLRSFAYATPYCRYGRKRPGWTKRHATNFSLVFARRTAASVSPCWVVHFPKASISSAIN
jgi:DNA excision repair protein ERCC-2